MRHPLSLFATLILLGACTAAPDVLVAPPSAAPSGPRLARNDGAAEVTGHTNFTYGPDLFQTTSFSVRREADGSVAGRVELNVHGTSTDFARGTAACMVVTGNEAVIGGPITESSFGATAWVMRVRDNGEGANSPRDQWSDFIYYLRPVADPATVCTAPLRNMYEIDGGNIQVH